MKLNRRDFLKGSLVLGGAAAVAGLAGCQTSASSGAQTAASASAQLPAGTTAEDFENSVVELEPISDFADEKTYDIVVVGAGTAGVPAVCAALEEGATVACLQKAPTCQANGNGSSGVILEESNEIGKLQYKQAWRKAGGYRMNPDLLDLFVEHSGETNMWILKNAEESGIAYPSASATKTDYDDGSFCTAVLKSVPKPQNHTHLMQALADSAAKNGAEFFYGMPAVQLVMEDGKVTGVIGKDSNGYTKFNANMAVILAAGDYQNNESLVKRYSPDIVRFGRKQAERTGDGILLGMTAGGAMTPVNHAKTMHDMDAAPMLMTKPIFMALDENGERFMNEDIPMESWDLALNRRPLSVEDPGRFFRIYDNAYADKYKPTVPIETLENSIPGFKDNPQGVYPELIDTHRADTLDELAEELGIPADALKKSVEKWNKYCETGVDEEFGVEKSKLKPIDTPPYWGTRQWIRCSAINSGVKINGNCQVLNDKDEVIPGLYSVGSGAGDICGGLEWNLAQGGLCCGSYMTMGRYAAIHAVTGDMKPSKPVSYDEAKHYWAK